MDKTSVATTLQLVDFFPILRPLMNIIPPQLSSFKRNLLEITDIENRLFMKLFKDARAKIEAGKIYPSSLILNDAETSSIDVGCRFHSRYDIVKR